MSDDYRNNAGNHWHGNTFGKIYIDPESSKRPNVLFVSAVKKMHRRAGSTLSREEIDADKQWIPQQTTTSNTHVTTPAATAADLMAQIGIGVCGKHKSDDISQGYDECMDHVIGSAAEVERLWSIARYILTTT